LFQTLEAEHHGIDVIGDFANIIDGLRLDRLSRSLHELLTLAERQQKQEIGLHSITELIDTTTPNGRLFFSIAGAFTQCERDVSGVLSERVAPTNRLPRNCMIVSGQSYA